MSAQPTIGDLDVTLLEATFNAVKLRGADLTAHFYVQLFAQHPAVIPLFANVKFEEQQGRLLSALALVVANLRTRMSWYLHSRGWGSATWVTGLWPLTMTLSEGYSSAPSHTSPDPRGHQRPPRLGVTPTPWPRAL